jgi:PAS domain-containing protein
MTDILNSASVLGFLLNKIPYGVAVSDMNMNIVLWNNEASQMLGTTFVPQQIHDMYAKGKFLRMDGKEVKNNERALYIALTEHIPAETNTKVEMGNRFVYVTTKAIPLYDENKNVIGAAAFFKDVTNQIQMETILKEVLEKLNEMQSYLKEFIKSV